MPAGKSVGADISVCQIYQCVTTKNVELFCKVYVYEINPRFPYTYTYVRPYDHAHETDQTIKQSRLSHKVQKRHICIYANHLHGVVRAPYPAELKVSELGATSP